MNFNGIHEILIIRLSSMGDILLTTPLIRSIKKKYPDIKISFLLKEQYKAILSNNPYISKIYLYNKDAGANKNIEINNLNSVKFDLIIDLQNNLRSRAVTFKLNSRVLRFHKKTFLKFLLVKFKINKLRNSPPIPERYAESLKNFDLDDEGLDLFKPEILLPELKKDNKYIGFAPGSRHFTKMWPEKYFIDLGNYLLKSGYSIVLFGGKDDKDTCARISGGIPGSVNLSNDDDIMSTAVNMALCRAMICNDSGMMHVGCALKIPVLAIFGSTVEEFGFVPYKNRSIVLGNDGLSCRPCTHIGRDSCPKKHFKCMMEVTPLVAFNKLKLLLEYR